MGPTEAINQTNESIDIDDNLVCLMKHRIAQDGYFHYGDCASKGIFKKLCRKLGEVMAQADIKVEQGGEGAFRQGEVRFHNEGMDINLIGWFCVEQDEKGGENLFIDTKKVINELNDHEIEVLKNLPLLGEGTHAGKGYRKRGHLLSEVSKELFHVLYMPYQLLVDEYSKEQLDVLSKFEKIIYDEKESALIRIRLEPGHFVIIDNFRLLHGRKALSKDSKRNLMRIWIETNQKFGQRC